MSQKISRGDELDPTEVKLIVERLIDPTVGAEEKAGFLTALALRGETVNEIAAFAESLRIHSVKPAIDSALRARGIIDVCGTGGDRLNTINVSTTVAFIVASAGMPVAKHGNRAVTSQAGSADVLDELGVAVNLEPDQAVASLRDHNFAFFFAPKYHPAFKNLAEARRLCAGRGQRTIFNFLGPLLNPASPSFQLMGVGHPSMCEPLARVLSRLGVRRGMVVSGHVNGGETGPFLDELSPLGDNEVAEFSSDGATRVSRSPTFCRPKADSTIEGLRGGDRVENAEWVRRILGGEEQGLRRDAVLLNAAGALWVGERVATMAAGWDLALNEIKSGRAMAKLRELQAAPRA